jgi:hypothetical protein
LRQKSRWKNSTAEFAPAPAPQNRADCVENGIGTASKVGEIIAKMSVLIAVNRCDLPVCSIALLVWTMQWFRATSNRV